MYMFILTVAEKKLQKETNYVYVERRERERRERDKEKRRAAEDDN